MTHRGLPGAIVALAALWLVGCQSDAEYAEKRVPYDPLTHRVAGTVNAPARLASAPSDLTVELPGKTAGQVVTMWRTLADKNHFIVAAQNPDGITIDFCGTCGRNSFYTSNVLRMNAFGEQTPTGVKFTVQYRAVEGYEFNTAEGQQIRNIDEVYGGDDFKKFTASLNDAWQRLRTAAVGAAPVSPNGAPDVEVRRRPL